MSWYAQNATFPKVLARLYQLGVSNASLITTTLITIAILSAVVFWSSSDSTNDNIHNLGGSWHLITAWTFFSKRYDFMRENFKKTGLKMFRFQLLQHRVIAMAGEENRKIFFNDRNLDLSSGARLFVAASPRLKDINVDMDPFEPQGYKEFVKRVSLLARKERIDEVLPRLLEDINCRMKDWGTEGKVNPFNEVYDLVFQMIVRMASCRELSEDREAVNQLAKHYWAIEKNATPVTILLPWFPSSAKKSKREATQALYATILSYVIARRKASTPSTDLIDFFILQGLSNDKVAGTIICIIFAGTVNTGVNACWALLHLGINPKWKHKAIDEYKALIDKYNNTTSSDPLHIRLATIPSNAWEDELPSVELIIRETLRISGSGTKFRRNIGEDIQAGERTIKRGDFVVYSIADANLNPDIYTNPLTFDPDRYGPGREEDRKEAFGYLAWGGGRHPCAGMKMAKLEIKLILAMMLLGYEYELVDGKGNYPKALPDQDRNDVLQSRPIGDPCYLKFKRIVE